jgi:hypothetical protein
MTKPFTDLARSLSNRAKDLGIEIKHTQALELIAAIDGNRNRHVLHTYSDPEEVLYQGKVQVYHHEVNKDSPEFPFIPFELTYFKKGRISIKRTDDRPFNERFYPEFKWENEDGDQFNNKDIKEIALSIEDKGTHYELTTFSVNRSKDVQIINMPKFEMDGFPVQVSFDYFTLFTDSGDLLVHGNTLFRD